MLVYKQLQVKRQIYLHTQIHFFYTIFYLDLGHGHNPLHRTVDIKDPLLLKIEMNGHS